MSIAQTQTTVFKQNCLSGLENFAIGTPYTYKIALYTSLANLNASTLTYTTTGEITGTGYTAGGKVLTISQPPIADNASNTAFISFANVTWNPAVFTAAGALIYNSTTNAAVAVLDFGGPKTQNGLNTFTITFPTATSNTAILSIS